MEELRPLNLGESNRLYTEACNIVAGGTTQSKRPELFIEGEYPLYAGRAEGAYIWDVDGNRFVDWTLGLGTIILGHCDPAVDEAAMNQIRWGFHSSMTKPVQNELAVKLVEIIPCAELVHFFQAGSDSTTAGVRLARIYTGRDKVVRWGYNGWHDWCCPHDAGIPSSVRDEILTFEYNNLRSLEKVLSENKGRIACIIMMPLEIEPPQTGFLEDVKALAARHEVLLIFDEMRSGFRMALGGAQQYYNVIPDLATFSKAISNGYTLSALVGRADVMECLHQTHLSSTFYTSSIAMAAALETIEQIEQRSVIEHIWHVGGVLLDGLNTCAKEAGLPIEAVGVPPMPDLAFHYENDQRCEEAKRIFYTQTIRAGVLLHPHHHWYVCAAHSEADLDRTLNACADAFAAVKQAM